MKSQSTFRANLSKFINEELIEKQKWLILGLLVLLIVILLHPFPLFLLLGEFELPYIITNLSQAVQLFILGAVTSALLAVLALGFSLIYGVAKQLKLSLGGYYVVGAYTMYFLLETIGIKATRIDIFGGVDEIGLLALVLLPIILTVAVLVYFWSIFSIREFFLILASPILVGGSIILFGGAPLIVEGLYAALAVLLLGLAAWYLELPERESAVGTFFLSVIVLIICVLNFIGFLDFPIIYVALMVLATMFTAFLAMMVDYFILNRFRASHVNTMIVTFSMALLLQSIIQIFYFPTGGDHFEQFGPEDRTLATIVPREPFELLGEVFRIFNLEVIIDQLRIISLILVVLICVLLYAFIWFSKMGMALRAVSQDEEAATLAGINIRKTTAIVSGIGMGLVAFAAILTSPFSANPFWSPFMGWWVLIMAIAVVTLGGMGSLPGSIIAAIIIGYSEVLISSIPDLAPFSAVIPFIVVLLVMIFKPEGLIGEKKELEG